MIQIDELKRGDIVYALHSGVPYIFLGEKTYQENKRLRGSGYGLKHYYTLYTFESTRTGQKAELFKEQVLGLFTTKR